MTLRSSPHTSAPPAHHLRHYRHRARHRARHRRFLASVCLVLTLASSLLALAGSADAATDHSRVQELLDAGQAAKALELLQKSIRGRPDAQELLLRSTAKIMLGEIKSGSKDLDQALELDPNLRQGWLNLAGLEIAEGRYPQALTALEKARSVDPSIEDVYLNLGAVLVLMGRRAEAKERFDRYLELAGAEAEAHFLVAANYALAGLEHLAISNLETAIQLDERQRLRARRDERFLSMDSLDYRVLLFTDDYVPPEDHHQVAAAFRQSYDQTDNQLLFAVLKSLRELDFNYDPEVETTARWALVWGDLRIKVTNQENGTGVLQLSAPTARFTHDDWHRRTQALFRKIYENLGG